MNGMEKLPDAIRKLVAELEASGHYEWRDKKDADFDTHYITAGSCAIATEMVAEDAALAVTLHRTIDAQLDLLRLAIEYGALDEGHGSRFSSAALALADAILGDERADD